MEDKRAKSLSMSARVSELAQEQAADIVEAWTPTHLA